MVGIVTIARHTSPAVHLSNELSVTHNLLQTLAYLTSKTAHNAVIVIYRLFTRRKLIFSAQLFTVQLAIILPVVFILTSLYILGK